MTNHIAILDFWFIQHGMEDWFYASDEFDARIKTNFSRLHAQAMAGELFSWRSSPKGRLAEILILDQFTRQLYRKTGRAFSADMQALTLAQEMVISGHDVHLENQKKNFAYMPFMHSESLAVHDFALPLFKGISEQSYEYATKHRDMIVEFGRYPYRNAALGRKNTPAEDAFLADAHSSFGQ
jgi:uncharacterized protein (DUF924 family)